MKPNEQLKKIGTFLLRSARHNLPFKLVAVVIAIVLWAGLILQDPSITREKTFSRVPVAIAGEETMKQNGFIVTSDLHTLLTHVELKADIPQGLYANATESNFNVRLDLSRIRQTGKQTLRIQTSNSSAYGVVSSISPSEIEVEVEDYITRYRVPVVARTTGKAPDGYYAAAPSVEPSAVSVSGPRSLVERVARAEAVVDQSQLPEMEGINRNAVPFRLMDLSGKAIESDLLQITSESVLVDSVVVQLSVSSMKLFPLSTAGIVTGTPAPGYEVKSIILEPSSIRAAGNQEDLELLNTLFSDSTVSVEGATESMTEHIRIRKPSELAFLSTDTVAVSIEIGPVITTRTFTDVKINLVGVERGYSAVLNRYNANLTVEGEQLAVSQMKASAVSLTADAAGLDEGVYDIALNAESEIGTAKAVPESVQLTLTKK